VIWFVPIFLCWGSFLNVWAYRLVRSQSVIFPRSYCPSCGHGLAWYDLIPVVSFIMLAGKCRYCATPISFLYPCIEIFTACVMSLLVMNIQFCYIPAYFVFFSALIVTIRSDIETMLISRYVTLFFVPYGLFCSAFGLLPIQVTESMVGFLLGYGVLYSVNYVVLKWTGKRGIGQGDLDLLAFIGVFTGPMGCWISLLIGSVSGSCVGIVYMLYTGASRSSKIPFGPFLAIGAIVFVLWGSNILELFQFA
jgi:leader peptidase (prepilin peptidase)/N-methyltransferase